MGYRKKYLERKMFVLEHLNSPFDVDLKRFNTLDYFTLVILP